jgi:putative DNA primase/helicase
MKSKIWISTGKSRQDTSWKNQEATWSKLVERLRKPVVTKETYSEYLAASKDKQADIKDVGGFVGGVVSGGRRLKNSVSSRQLITLDIDYATESFWTDFCLEFQCEAILYTTHKHSPSTPRYRLLIPLASEVHSDEYEAIARKVAGRLNIELFDPTTFQPERLMFWPSVSADGVYELKHQEGNWLDGLEILNEYDDWKDVSKWPISVKVNKRILDAVAKQEDPLGKPAHVGVFCRCYGIEEAIAKYLSHVYEEVSEERYTYTEGSTSGGLVVYDNKFAYSHHSTDPVSGRLCDAFDLVRIHMYGDSDDRVDEKTPLAKKPSYGKMIDLMVEDPVVKTALISEKLEVKKQKTQVGVDSDWLARLEMDAKKKEILNTIQNCVIVLENDELLRGSLAYDDLRKIPVLKKDLPWRKVEKYTRSLTDADDAEFRNYLEIMYGLTSREKIKDALEIAIHKNVFHPVKDYLRELRWDGVKRVDKLLIDHLGAEDTEYVREVTRKTLVAAVARVYEPGVKFDTMLVLVGPQGVGKSRLVMALGREWFSDTFGNLQNKDAMEQIQGVWIMEIGELAGLKKQEVDAVKLFVSKQEDRFRVAYGRRVETFARQCIFIGTTNNDEFLQDQTGNRRFWPVRCGEKGRVERLTKEIVGQVWAEACEIYANGEDLHLEERVEKVAREVQEQYTERSDMAGLLEDYLETPLPTSWMNMNKYQRREYLSSKEEIEINGVMLRTYVTVPEIWEEMIGGQIKDMNKFSVKSIRDFMNKRKGWKKELINRKPYGTQRGWTRESDAATLNNYVNFKGKG